VERLALGKETGGLVTRIPQFWVNNSSNTIFLGDQYTVLVLPPPKWCTDNGVMVAWAGVERLALGREWNGLGGSHQQHHCSTINIGESLASSP